MRSGRTHARKARAPKRTQIRMCRGMHELNETRARASQAFRSLSTKRPFVLFFSDFFTAVIRCRSASASVSAMVLLFILIQRETLHLFPLYLLRH